MLLYANFKKSVQNTQLGSLAEFYVLAQEWQKKNFKIKGQIANLFFVGHTVSVPAT